MHGYMLDTNLFNRLVDGELAIDALLSKKLIATHVQFDELNATANEARRKLLLMAFSAVSPKVLPTSTAIYDDSRYDMSNYCFEDGLYEKMLARLKEFDRAKRKKPIGQNQSRDIRIAETAIRNDFVLVTDDRNLRTLALEFGGVAINLQQFAQR